MTNKVLIGIGATSLLITFGTGALVVWTAFY